MVQVKHQEGLVVLQKSVIEDAATGKVRDIVLPLTVEEATGLFAPTCPNCKRPVGQAHHAVAEAANHNRVAVGRRIEQLEAEIRKLRASV